MDIAFKPCFSINHVEHVGIKKFVPLIIYEWKLFLYRNCNQFII